VANHEFSNRCGFCLENLHPVPLDGVQLLLLLVGLRHVQCPHCFVIRLKPYGLLKPLAFPFWGAARIVRTVLKF